MNRRELLLSSAAASSLLMMPSWAKASRHSNLLLPSYSALDMSPAEKLSVFNGSSVVEGDTPDEAHEIFWNKAGYLQKKGGIPAPVEHFDVVIVGGGMSGLSAAYKLPGKKVLLIEGNPRMGGNSKTQYVGKTFISQGAAYLGAFEPGDELDRLYTELNIKRYMRNTGGESEPVTFRGKIVNNFWAGETDPNRANDFKNAKELLADIYENKLPELPIWNSSASARSYLNGLDRISFTNFLKRELGQIHPHVMEMITLYCWSSFSGSPDEISAAQGLYFFASDTHGGANVLPGGNGLLASAMFEKLRTRSGVTMLAPCFAVDIRTSGGKAQICFKNPAGILQTVTATKCIVASQKMVAKHVIDGLGEKQKKAMSLISYRAYLVANLFMRKKIPSPGYDVYALQGTVPSDPYNDSKSRTVADIVYADWASKDNVDRSVLTCYIPLPYDMAQQYLFIDTLYPKYVDRVRASVEPQLAGMGLNWGDVGGMRLVRYGHSMPLAQTGQIADGTFENAGQDIGGCIYFANQDNWGNPCFETSYGSALDVVRKMR